MFLAIKRQAIAEASFFVVLMAVAGLLGLYIPPLLFLTNIIIPVLLALLILRLDIVTALVSVAAFIVLLAVFLGLGPAVFILVGHTVPLGFVMGLLFRYKATAGVNIGLSSLTNFLFTLLGMACAFWIKGINPLAAGDEIKQAVEQAADWYVQAGLARGLSGGDVEAMLKETATAVSQLIPLNIALLSIMDAFLAYWLTVKIFARFKLNRSLPGIPPLAQWQFPWYFCWGVIIGLGLILTGDFTAAFPAGVIGKNILFLAFFLYLVDGIAVSRFYLDRWKVHVIVKFMLIILAVFNLPFVMAILALLGLTDTFVNWRRFSELAGLKKGKGGE